MPETIKIIAEQAINESISVLSILFSESSLFLNLNEWFHEWRFWWKRKLWTSLIYLWIISFIRIAQNNVWYLLFTFRLLLDSICSFKNVGGHSCLISVAYIQFIRLADIAREFQKKKDQTPFSHSIFLPKNKLRYLL